MKRGIVCVLLGLCAVLLSFDIGASEELELKFPSVSSSDEIPATILRPTGEGPFPAIVIVHDCSGLGPKSSGAPMRWGQDLVQQGYVIMIPDSFTPRGMPGGVCTPTCKSVECRERECTHA